MLHHLSIPVTSLERSGAFYDAALAALGYVRVQSDPDFIGYGYSGDGDNFAIQLASDGITVPGPGCLRARPGRLPARSGDQFGRVTFIAAAIVRPKPKAGNANRRRRSGTERGVWVGVCDARRARRPSSCSHERRPSAAASVPWRSRERSRARVRGWHARFVPRTRGS